jgi:peptide/nickel transport system ATP-binding protein
MKGSPILQVSNLVVDFHTPHGVARAVDGASFDLYSGETLGLVGESGSGKSVSALSILGLLSPSARVVSGTIHFEGRDLLQLSARELRAVRGKEIAMIFQEPMTSLNPLFTVGRQVAEVVRHHERVSRRVAWDRAVEMLRTVEIPDPERRAASYPHELSGGMRQRVMIAMALVCRPKLLIADEPTTALDATIEAEILDLLSEMQKKFSMSVLLITHDLGVVSRRASEVAVLYSGRIIEQAHATDIFMAPAHPYTRMLLDSLPRLYQRHARLAAIPGAVPEPDKRPDGCRFGDRCPRVTAECTEEEPELEMLAGPRSVACRHRLMSGELL